MARFISYFDPFNKIPHSINGYLENACLFFSQNNLIDLTYESIEALNGHFKGLVVYRDNERQRIHHDNKLIVISDGNPLVGNKFIDANAIANLYRKYNPDYMAKKLDGSHTELIIDKEKMKIILVRDRVGLKPVYYAKNNRAFILSSNIGAIVKTDILIIKPNEKMVAKYATCNYRTIYGGVETFFENIYLAGPGTLNTYSKKGLSTKKYWDFNIDSDYTYIESDKLNAKYKKTILHSVKNCLDASDNQPLVVALGGGIDSGTIVGMLHKLTGNKVDAISLSYNEETDYNESQLIQYSVRDHVLKWHNIKLDPNVLLNDLNNLYNRFDLPLSTVSSYGYDYLYREIKKLGYKLIYNGSGGDQLQAGNYPSFFYHLADLKFLNDTSYEAEIKSWIKNHSTKQFPKSINTIEDYFKKHIDFSVQGELKPFEQLLTPNNILSDDIKERVGNLNANIVTSYGSYLRTYMVQEFHHDALAPTVETQNLIDWFQNTSTISPLNSKIIMYLGWSLPSISKIKNGVNKVLARNALRGICANEILNRIPKSGFNAPFDIWIRGPLNEFTMDIFNSKSFLERGIYNNKKFQNILNNHMNDNQNHMMFLWQSLNLELWMRSWIDQ